MGHNNLLFDYHNNEKQNILHRRNSSNFQSKTAEAERKLDTLNTMYMATHFPGLVQALQ